MRCGAISVVAAVSVLTTASGLHAADVNGLNVTVSGAPLVVSPVPDTSVGASGFTYLDATGNMLGATDAYTGTSSVGQRYWLIGGNYGSGYVAGSLTLGYNALQTSFSFLWGTPDNDNKVTFLSGSTVVGSFTGLQYLTAFSYPGYPNTPVNQVTVSGFLGGVFDKVVFSAISLPMEVGNFSATPVPGPIAGAGLPVLALAGYLAWRRRRAVAA